MYSWEIDNVMKNHNYHIPSYLYLEMFDVNISTQISRIRYHAYNNFYEAWTYDNYYWRFNVYYKEKQR